MVNMVTSLKFFKNLEAFSFFIQSYKMVTVAICILYIEESCVNLRFALRLVCHVTSIGSKHG